MGTVRLSVASSSLLSVSSPSLLHGVLLLGTCRKPLGEPDPMPQLLQLGSVEAMLQAGPHLGRLRQLGEKMRQRQRPGLSPSKRGQVGLSQSGQMHKLSLVHQVCLILELTCSQS